MITRNMEQNSTKKMKKMDTSVKYYSKLDWHNYWVQKLHFVCGFLTVWVNSASELYNCYYKGFIPTALFFWSWIEDVVSYKPRPS